MARKLRIEYPGAIYHAMSRGNHGDAIFRAEEDRKLFLKTLGQACERTGWLIHAFVLMGIQSVFDGDSWQPRHIWTHSWDLYFPLAWQ